MRMQKAWLQASLGVIILSITCASMLLVFILQSKIQIFNLSNQRVGNEKMAPFPVSVDPRTKTIDESSFTNNHTGDSLAVVPRDSWWDRIVALFSKEDWYQNLASPSSRIIVIWPGERKEQVIKSIGDILNWSDSERLEFKSLIDKDYPTLSEGKYFPGQYVTSKEATPKEVASLIVEQFEIEVLDRYTSEIEAVVPIKDALIIASLLEREASDFSNMREVSGVIWNRLFIDMPLQLDATLQYVRGSDPYIASWWPRVRTSDKFIDSPYNTYGNKGLPPAPIANPSAEAVLAALNPVETDCLFYLHTDSGEYFCSIDYEAHVEKLHSLYGRGS